MVLEVYVFFIYISLFFCYDISRTLKRSRRPLPDSGKEANNSGKMCRAVQPAVKSMKIHFEKGE